MYTKSTIVTFEVPRKQFDSDYSEAEFNFINDSFSKAAEMESDGKTSGFLYYLKPGVAQRLWVDQEAAEEWKTYILDCAKTHNVGIASIEIFDYKE
jgi:hypothetical protein